jgi:hypothetical protein
VVVVLSVPEVVFHAGVAEDLLKSLSRKLKKETALKSL